MNKESESPLAVAKSRGNDAVAKVLLEHGATEIHIKKRKQKRDKPEEETSSDVIMKME